MFRWHLHADTQTCINQHAMILGQVRTLHKIKEQQRRAKKRLLLSTLQSMVLGEGDTNGANGKSSGITGNYILELVLVQLEKEKIETSSGGTGVAAHVKAEDGP